MGGGLGRPPYRGRVCLLIARAVCKIKLIRQLRIGLGR